MIYTDMEYDVIERRTLNILINDVNTWIKKGWKPIGGVCVVKSETFYYHLQTMIKGNELTDLDKYYEIRKDNK